MSAHNLHFEQKYEKYQNFYLKTQVLEVKFSICLNRCVFVMLFAFMYIKPLLKKKMSTLKGKKLYIDAPPSMMLRNVGQNERGKSE